MLVWRMACELQVKKAHRGGSGQAKSESESATGLQMPRIEDDCQGTGLPGHSEREP
jgi:hypothetical protein